MHSNPYLPKQVCWHNP